MLSWNVRPNGVTFTHSAGKHGYNLDDAIYACTHMTKYDEFQHHGEWYMKLTGEYHGDPLVQTIEVMMRIARNGRLIIFHVNAEQGNFWDKD